jgi:archaemetzincin
MINNPLIKTSYYKLIAVYMLCLLLCAWSCKDNRIQNISSKKYEELVPIYLLPYQGFDSNLVDGVQTAIGKHFFQSPKILQPVALPATAWQPERVRYQADSLLKFQLKLSAQYKGIIVGLTDNDIATSKGNIKSWGVFGLGYCPGNACVIATKRMLQPGTNKALLNQRLQKVVLHELGHNWGLPHCTNALPCLMKDAKAKLSVVDAQPIAFCDTCKNLLKKHQKNKY